MKRIHILALALITAVAGTSAALAAHVVQLDPATVPTGFLAAHSEIEDVPLSALARAVTPDGTEVSVQHVRLGPNAATGWHTHPGPAVVEVVAGSLTYEDGAANRCRLVTYVSGQGFVDPGFGHVHRAVAGPSGVDFYVVYLLPPGSETHVTPRDPAPECA